jgi:hypothetical protein
MANFQVAQQEQQQKEQTEAEKAAEDQRKAALDAEKKRKKAELAALDAEAAADQAVLSEPLPVPGANLPTEEEEEMVFEPTDADFVDFAQSEYDRAVQQDPEAREVRAGGEAGRELADAQLDSKLAQIDAEMQAIEKGRELAEPYEERQKELRQEIADERVRIDEELTALVQSKPRKPSPSVLNLVGVFLGGLIAPMQGGRNVALETVMKRMQQEVEVDQENRRTTLSGLRTARGLLDDKEKFRQTEEVAGRIELAQKMQGYANELKLKAQSTTLPAEATAAAKVQWHAAEAVVGKLIKEGAMMSHKQWLAEQELLRKQKADLLKARKDSKGKGGKDKQVVGSYGPAVYYDSFRRKLVSEEEMSTDERKAARERSVPVPLWSKSAQREVHGLLAQDPTRARKLQSDYMVGLGVQDKTKRLVQLLRGTTKNGRLSIAGGYSTAEGAQVQSAFTDLMNAIKDKWGLGAIQAPDMVLLEGRIGQTPSGFLAWINSTAERQQIEGVLQDLGSGEALILKGDIMRNAGLPDDLEVRLPAFDPTADIKKRQAVTPEATAAERLGDVSGAIEIITSDIPGPGGGDLGTVTNDEFQGYLDNVVEATLLSEDGNKSDEAIAGGKALAQFRRWQVQKDIPSSYREQIRKAGDLIDKNVRAAKKAAQRAAEKKAGKQPELEKVKQGPGFR